MKYLDEYKSFFVFVFSIFVNVSDMLVKRWFSRDYSMSCGGKKYRYRTKKIRENGEQWSVKFTGASYLWTRKY